MKKTLAIIAGVISGFLMVFVGDATAHALHPMPLGLNYMDKAVMLSYIAGIPTFVLVVMTVFWMLSAFTGALVAVAIKRAEWKSVSLTTGGILLAAALLNLVMTAPSHPLWMWLTALLGYLPFSLLGGYLMWRWRRNRHSA